MTAKAAAVVSTVNRRLVDSDGVCVVWKMVPSAPVYTSPPPAVLEANTRLAWFVAVLVASPLPSALGWPISARLLTMTFPEEESEIGPVKVFRPVRRISAPPDLVREIFALAPSVMRPVIRELEAPFMRKSAVPEAAVLVIKPALVTLSADLVVELPFTLTPLRSNVVPWRRIRL